MGWDFPPSLAHCLGIPPRLIAARTLFFLSFSGKHALIKGGVEGVHTILTVASASAGTEIPGEQPWSLERSSENTTSCLLRNKAAGNIAWVGSAGEAFPLTMGDWSHATGVSATSIIDLEPGHGDYEGFFRLVRECEWVVGLLYIKDGKLELTTYGTRKALRKADRTSEQYWQFDYGPLASGSQ
ncbi:hypothetical protein DFP72DRAFT_1081936 [Ephemerocybe angulata]|uniref:Uncharacterized protein n=1 Tax=Ephemerocybe angulata TaxID=980116 RepID=A0A8H6LTS4_9AGAR|nr:hypothetical protein DFP72DRAFT_1081936 [Tulosesus angulatus]